MKLTKYLSKTFAGTESLLKDINSRLNALETDTTDLDASVITLTPLVGSKSYTPGEIAADAQVSTTVTVTGATLGKFSQAAFSLSLAGAVITSYVSAANTVTVVIRNNTGDAITLGAGTLSARVS